MKYAAIDAGSNTLRLLIGSLAQGGIVPYIYERHICRLADKLSLEDGLTSEAMERTHAAFMGFAQSCKDHNVAAIKAVGTAAFRDAVNGADFAERIRRETGIPLKIISGKQEAEFTSVGVLSALDPVPGCALIVDIGGGSTEFILCLDGEVVWETSYPLGVVRLIDSCKDQKDRQATIARDIKAVYNDISAECIRNRLCQKDLCLVGTAGTVTTIAALDLGMEEYDWRRVNNYTLDVRVLQYWYQRLTLMGIPDREALPGMEVGRGDLIIPGLEILLYLLQVFQLKRLIASDFGILEGLLLSHKDSMKSRSFD